MATKVSGLTQLIKIEEPTGVKHFNKNWVSVEFRGTDVLLGSELQESVITIPMADFQDGTGTPITTEDTIASYLGGLLETATLSSAPYTGATATTTFSSPREIINCTTGTFSVFLPTAVGIAGTSYTLKNSGAGIITLDADGTETIDGNLDIQLTQYQSITVVSDGTNFFII